MKYSLTFFICLCALGLSVSTSAFPLTDTDPESPGFRARFLGSYGINTAIEPKIAQKDRSLYESIAPHLQSDPEKAIQLALKGIDAESNAAFDFLVGSLYYSQQNYTEAERYLKQAIEKFPYFRRAHRNLSLIYVQRADYQKAIPHLLTVIKLGGGDGQSYSMLGYCYLNQEKYVSALSAYRMARMFIPESTDVRRGEAQCLLMTQQLDAAISLFDELISESPEEPDYWLLQSNAYVAQQRLDEAIANLEIAHSIEPGAWETHKLLADLYIAQNVAKLALFNYTAALTINPKISAENAFTPLRQLIERNLYAEAANYLNTLNTTLQSPLSPQQAVEKKALTAQLEIKTGNPEKGLQQLKDILKTDPLNGKALLTIADYKMSQTHFAEAEFYFERARSVPEVQVDALIGLARTAVQQGRFAQALAYLERAQEIQPRNDIKRYIARVENAVTARN